MKDRQKTYRMSVAIKILFTVDTGPRDREQMSYRCVRDTIIM